MADRTRLQKVDVAALEALATDDGPAFIERTPAPKGSTRPVLSRACAAVRKHLADNARKYYKVGNGDQDQKGRRTRPARPPC